MPVVSYPQLPLLDSHHQNVKQNAAQTALTRNQVMMTFQKNKGRDRLSKIKALNATK